MDFRPRRWPWKLGVALNVLVALAFVGWPLWRGRRRARAARHAFARAAACLVGAEASASPGVVLPERAWSDYAAQVERHPQGWPQSCVPLLERVAPAPATLLFPGVKAAEADLREALRRVESELAVIRAPRRVGARIPSRPLEAMQRAAAALTMVARASGATEALELAVIREDAPPPLRPTRVPLDADGDARLWLELTRDGFAVVGIGRQHVGWTRVQGGHMHADGALRSPGLRGARLDPDGVFWLWATSPARCAERPEGCRQRAFGVGYAPFEATELPSPTWLAGHPAGALSLSVSPTEGSVSLLALGASPGEVVWRRFEWSESGPTGTDLDAGSRRVQRPVWERPLGEALAALTPRGDVLLATPSGRLERISVDTPARLLGELLGAAAGDPRSWQGDRHGSCLRAEDELWWLAGGDEEGGLRHRRLPAGSLSVRRVADAEGSTLFALNADAELRMSACDHAPCGPWELVSLHVVAFDAARERGRGVLALVHEERGPTRVLSFEDGAHGQERSLLPCFDRRGGGCGPARLSSGHGRILLAMREGLDVLAVETSDGGEHFRPARGL